MPLLCAAACLAASPALAQDYGPPAPRASARAALAPVTPPVTPEFDSEGTQRLRLRLHYLETVTSNVELRRDLYPVDENLKRHRPRTSVAWYLRLYF